MKLVLELNTEDFEKVATGEMTVIPAAVAEVEIHQADGLLVLERRPLAIEAVGSNVRHYSGIAPSGAPIRVYVAQEEADGNRE